MKFISKIQVARTRFRERVLAYTEKPHASWWLAFFSFTESSFSPIAPDLLLIAITLARPFRWLWYVIITTGSSVAGGLFGYFIGAFLFQSVGESVISFYGAEDTIAKLGVLFEANAFLTIFSAAFTPIPYKIFTLSAGFFSINVLIFIIASLVGRSLRFFILGFIVKKFGERFSSYVFRYFDIITLIVLALVILFFLAL